MREGYIRLSVLVEQTQGIVQMPSFRSAIQWQSPHEESTYSIYIEDRPAADLHGKRLRKSGRADAGTKAVNHASLPLNTSPSHHLSSSTFTIRLSAGCVILSSNCSKFVQNKVAVESEARSLPFPELSNSWLTIIASQMISTYSYLYPSQ